jgi:hypothetical protein
MTIENLITLDEVMRQLAEKKRLTHLLMGNGFSMAFDSGIFSYNALSNFIERSNNEVLKKLFGIVNTKNFEQIMQQLDNFSEIASLFSKDKELVSKIQNASATLKSSLIEAVKELHPEHVFKIPEENSLKCLHFLHRFIGKGGRIFTANYDLLLYWVLMRNNSEFAIDGFGREAENPDEIIIGDEPEFSELRWGKHKADQTIFYIHGALPLFDDGIDIVKEEYDNQNYLLEKIKSRMEKKDYPIFVTAGNAREKLNHIMHNKYLSFCYEALCNIKGSLITFGFNFGEYDTHIIDAINKAAQYGRRSGDKLLSVYIGVYSENDLNHIESIRKKFKCKITPYNARTASIWR